MLSDLLNEAKGFKYQITLKTLLKNTNSMEKLNLGQFISTQQQKQWPLLGSSYMKLPEELRSACKKRANQHQK